MDATISFTVNGKQRTVVTDPDRPLLDVLREDLHLTGAKYGCGEGQCGACTVLVDGRRMHACKVPIADMAGKSVRTIEGLSGNDEPLHPVQQAFLDEHAFQCGYCTPGMIMSAIALLEETPKPDDAQIREGMNGNLCRCCGYAKILSAVKAAVAAGVGGRQP
jgi:aerobic-type carbon monoxide dehydrogenase small subunit (CoxS/CutS family)